MGPLLSHLASRAMVAHPRLLGKSTDASRDLLRPRQVSLGIQLSHVGPPVAKDELRPLDPELLRIAVAAACRSCNGDQDDTPALRHARTTACRYEFVV